MMKELANKIIFSSKEGEDSEDSKQTESKGTKMKITTLVRVEDLGKIPHDEDISEVDTKVRKGKKSKFSSKLVL